ncbi:hypothetical protein BOTBODRAFT_33740 [Botryobasidium botryosum FD-172 SS1]|uniref:Zn(2)-C6 fungal-type domain-containing protein n=1 Tax=Botryobasidium botryosum (strain FD-172 SS1) TaxID=930990 RepID=A0A067MC31_BOTB1|nr:hypothetical protein BOTBODRAFT_33740 [Botryobasidium botryosum FD-172 SS1]
MHDTDSHPARLPRTKACHSCRVSKHRCDGDEQNASVPCSRCARNNRQCIWPVPKKKGRPRKFQPSVNASAEECADPNPPKDVPMDVSVITPVSMPRSTSSPSASSSTPALSAEADMSPSLSNQLPTLSLDTDQGDVATAAKFNGFQSVFDEDVMVDFPRSEPSIMSINIHPEVLHLIDLFYTIPQTFIPLLPPRHVFLQNVHNTSPLLMNAVLALASPYLTKKPTTDYRSVTLALLAQPIEGYEGQVPPLRHQIDRIQAMLLLTQLDFGLANVRESCEFLHQAIQLAIGWGWNVMDARRDIIGGFPGSHSGMPDGPETADGGQREPELEFMTELKRRTWWELWATDIMLKVAGGAKRVLEGVPVHVNTPSDLDVAPQNEAQKFYPLRIKTLSLLLEASDFPPCTTSAMRAENNDRLHSLDSMIDNAMMQCHGAWTDADGICDQGEDGREWAVSKNMFFMCMLMLNAASIHLHHLYALPELHFDIDSCALTPPPYTLASFHPINPNPPPLPAASIAKIITQSRLIMSLFRHSHQSSITRSGPMQQKGDYQNEDILRHSPFCGCSQVIAAFGSAIEVATASTKWQALAAESNLDTAKHVLSRLKRVWPIAAHFEGELTKCHDAVQSTLQLW